VGVLVQAVLPLVAEVHAQVRIGSHPPVGPLGGSSRGHDFRPVWGRPIPYRTQAGKNSAAGSAPSFPGNCGGGWERGPAARAKRCLLFRRGWHAGNRAAAVLRLPTEFEEGRQALGFVPGDKEDAPIVIVYAAPPRERAQIVISPRPLMPGRRQSRRVGVRSGG